jgi:hypothetical protein
MTDFMTWTVIAMVGTAIAVTALIVRWGGHTSEMMMVKRPVCSKPTDCSPGADVNWEPSSFLKYDRSFRLGPAENSSAAF